MFCQIHSSIHCSRFSSKLFISKLYTSGLKLKVVPSSFRSFSSEPTRLSPNPFSIKVTQSSHKWWIPRSPRHVITVSQTAPNEVSVETRLEQRNPNGTTESTSRQKGLFRTVYDRVLATFLPAGYPHSVSPEYTSYCQWSFLNSVAGSVTGVLSTQSLLFAIGLGAGSIPLAAALNWIIKDGLGQFGGVLYASLTGSRFDSEPKKIRFNAALAMQFATVIELLTPLYPAGFLAMASISNIGKNIAWLASSATRAQMHQTFALKDNLGDITAKSGSQATAASLFGTGIGILVSANVGTEFSHVFLSFLPFSFITLYSMYKSNVAVITSTLNVQRCERLLEPALPILVRDASLSPSPSAIEISATIPILTPAAVSTAESFLFVSPYKTPFVTSLSINPNLSASYFTYSPHSSSTLPKTLKDGYVIQYNAMERQMRLWYLKDCSEGNALKGFLHATVARYLIENKVQAGRNKMTEKEMDKDTGKLDHGNDSKVLSVAGDIVDKRYSEIRKALEEKGWAVDNVFVDTDRKRRVSIETIIM